MKGKTSLSASNVVDMGGKGFPAKRTLINMQPSIRLQTFAHIVSAHIEDSMHIKNSR